MHSAVIERTKTCSLPFLWLGKFSISSIRVLWLCGWSHLLVNCLELFSAWLSFLKWEVVVCCSQKAEAGLSLWTDGNGFVIFLKKNLCLSLSEGNVCIKANAQSCGECIQVAQNCGWCSDEVSWISPAATKQCYHHVNEKLSRRSETVGAVPQCPLWPVWQCLPHAHSCKSLMKLNTCS